MKRLTSPITKKINKTALNKPIGVWIEKEKIEEVAIDLAKSTIEWVVTTVEGEAMTISVVDVVDADSVIAFLVVDKKSLDGNFAREDIVLSIVAVARIVVVGGAVVSTKGVEPVPVLTKPMLMI